MSFGRWTKDTGAFKVIETQCEKCKYDIKGKMQCKKYKDRRPSNVMRAEIKCESFKEKGDSENKEIDARKRVYDILAVILTNLVVDILSSIVLRLVLWSESNKETHGGLGNLYLGLGVLIAIILIGGITNLTLRIKSKCSTTVAITLTILYPILTNFAVMVLMTITKHV